MKPHRSILLAALLCLIMIVPPVFAWTEEWSDTLAGSETGNYHPMIAFSNATYFDDVTRLTSHLNCYVTDDANWGGLTGAYATRLCEDGANPCVNPVANVTINYTVTGFADYNAECDFEFLFSNFDLSAYPAANMLYIEQASGYYFTNIYTKRGASGAYPANNYAGYLADVSTGTYYYAGNASNGQEAATYTGTSVVTPVASFNCVPTSQFPDTDVVCTDTSTNSPTDWYWSIDAEAMGIDGWMTSTSQNFTWQSHFPGFYTVNLKANNSAGFDWENKTNYVSISENATPNNCLLPLATGYSRTFFQCTDAQADAAIIGCNIQLNDLEGGAWSNTTDSTDGRWCIDTLPFHHINGYGQATGYGDGEAINAAEWNGQVYTIPMVPGYLPNATAGNVWVYVHVTELGSGINLPGTTVSLSGTGLATVYGTTDGSGSVSLQWPNSTTAYINAVKAGYTTGVKVITTSLTGPDIVPLSLHKGTHTITMTPTTPDYTTPPTIDPDNPDGGDYPDGYTNVKATEWMGWLAEHGFMLVELCFFVTICALLGFKFGK